MKNNGQTALVTGAHGFIGSHLCGRLEKEGFKVVAIPRKLLMDSEQLAEFYKANNPDFIFHLAAYGNHSNQVEQSAMVVANILGTLNVLQASLRVPVKGIINFGSSSEYGKTLYAMRESDVLMPQTFYGATKASATCLARAFAVTNDRSVITVRPFSVYGEGEADFRFIPTVIRKIVHREELQLIPDQGHDWIYIDDFIDGVMKTLEVPVAWMGQPVNIGTGIETSNKDIVHKLVNISDNPNLKMKLITNANSNDSTRWVADNSAISELGWKPQTSLDAGLARTFAYYKDKYGKPTKE
jgi:nucleoside-diphosphate-sugar epimerase